MVNSFDFWEGGICHSGIPGMRWGVRRYRNEDGTLTEAGRKRLYKDLKYTGKAYAKEAKTDYRDLDFHPVKKIAGVHRQNKLQKIRSSIHELQTDSIKAKRNQQIFLGDQYERYGEKWSKRILKNNAKEYSKIDKQLNQEISEYAHHLLEKYAKRKVKTGNGKTISAQQMLERSLKY